MHDPNQFFALRSAAYEEQQTHLRLIVVVVHNNVWLVEFNTNKNRLEKSSNFAI
jgi:hypothetical protein